MGHRHFSVIHIGRKDIPRWDTLPMIGRDFGIIITMGEKGINENIQKPEVQENVIIVFATK